MQKITLSTCETQRIQSTHIATNTGIAKVKKSMKIHPNSVSSIPLYLANVPKDSCVLLEPSYKLPLLGLAGAKCLVDSRNNIPHMQVLNPTNKAITLRATTTIADASVVDPASVFTLDHPKQHATSKTKESHDPIQFDLEQSDLSSEQNVNSLSIPTSLCICVQPCGTWPCEHSASPY